MLTAINHVFGGSVIGILICHGQPCPMVRTGLARMFDSDSMSTG